MADTITSLLVREHQQMRALVEEIELATEPLQTERLKAAIRQLRVLVVPHALIEESVLFLLTVRHLPKNEPKTPELIAEHHATLAATDKLLALADLASPEHGNQLAAIAEQLSESLEDHLKDEEETYFPFADGVLDPEEQAYALQQFAKIKGSNPAKT